MGGPGAGQYTKMSNQILPPPPPAPEPPSPRITCSECSFSFIVGAIAVAPCPNCGSEVATGRDES